MRRALCMVRRPFTVETNCSNIMFYKTTGSTLPKFYMEQYVIPMSENYKIGSERISKIATIFRTTGYICLNFCSEHRWNRGMKNCNEKNL